MKNITKIYVACPGSVLYEKEVNYLIMSNKCWPENLTKLSRNSYISEIHYDEEADLARVMNTDKTFYNKDIVVRRVFKSMKMIKSMKGEPKKSFLMQVAMGVSGLIKKPVVIKVTDSGASEWAVALTQLWAKELDKPEVFAKAGIKPVIDISPEGTVNLHITKSGDHIIVFFKQDISDLV